MVKNNIAKISIITAVKNGEKFLEKTIEKIINQKNINFEYIVIDGKSTDSTLKIIEKYKKNISYFVSEEDEGISDAFNKGVKAATGEFINFQGDGDGFTYDKAVYDLFCDVDTKKFDLVCGRVNRVSLDDKIIFTSPYIKNFRKESLLFKLTLPHQGLFTKKKLFEKFGYFDRETKYAMDYEHLLRMYYDFPNVKFKNIILSNWRADGHGNNQDIKILKEYNFIKIKNKVAPVLILKLINIWSVFKLKFKKLLNYK